MSDNFDRQYILKVGIPGEEGFEEGRAKSENGMPLHISFSLEKGDKSSNNTGTIKVWNLNASHRKAVKKAKCTVELMAGYGSNLPLIFVGNVTKVSTTADNADRVTEISATDGLVAVKETFVSVSYKKGSVAITVTDAIASKMGCSIIYSKNAKAKLSSKKLRNGFSSVGPGKNVLNKICSMCRLQWSIQNGVIQIVEKGQPISNKVYVISTESGLLERPKKISITDTKNSKRACTGYEVKYMLNGAIGIDDYVRLESREKKGFFKVCKLTIVGDNFGDSWTCTAQLREVVKK